MGVSFTEAEMEVEKQRSMNYSVGAIIGMLEIKTCLSITLWFSILSRYVFKSLGLAPNLS